MTEREEQLQKEADERNLTMDKSGRRQSHFEVQGVELVLIED